ncbi:MAG: hypothetical protein R2865_15855 [Deinococcales bacterium]
MGVKLRRQAGFASAGHLLDFHLSAIIRSRNTGLSNINNGRIAITELADLQDRVKLAGGRVSYVEIRKQVLIARL